jgi:hypothetical protein
LAAIAECWTPEIQTSLGQGNPRVSDHQTGMARTEIAKREAKPRRYMFEHGAYFPSSLDVPTFREFLDKLCAESRQIIRLATGHKALIDNYFFVDPVTASILDVGANA